MFKSKPTAKKLLAASTKGDSTKIKRYLKAGIKVDIVDDNGKTPLHLACSSGSESSVTTLLTSGSDAFAKDTNGCIPLHFVGKSDVISSILDSVTKEIAYKMLEEVDNGGKTALHYAVQNGNIPATRTLILRNSNIDKTDNAGKTPLEYATSDKFKAQLQKILMEKDKKDGEDSQKLLDIFKRGDILTLKQIIQNGKNVNSKNLEGQTFIHISAITQLKDVSIFLLEQGIDVNIKDNSQKTPLHYCAINGIVDITELLLVNGKCDPDPKDGFLSTPLHYAAEWNKPKVIQLLLENKANIEEKNGEGCTALHQACKYGRLNTFNFLMQNKANVSALDNHQRTPLHYATKWGRVKILSELLKEDVNINAEDDEGKTALHYSSEIRKESVLSLLLSNNNANSTIIDQSQRTPLHILLQWPKPRNISLQSGVEVFNSKKAPIHTNAIQSHNQCAILLIQHMLKENPLSINYQDIDGRSPLHWAIINRHKEIAIYLINEANADVTIVDKLKSTPLSPLTQSSHRDIAQEIEKAAEQSATSLRVASPELKKRKKKEKSKTKSSSELPNDFIVEKRPDDLAEINNLFYSGQIKIEEVIEKTFADKQNIFHLVAAEGHWDLFNSLLPSASIDLLNVRDNYGHTPLLLAARNGHENIVEQLIKSGADLKMEELENIDKELYDKLLEMETISDVCRNKKEELVFQKEIQCD